MAEPLQVEVVSADRLVWEGHSINVIVRTTEGDIGILPRHEDFLAGLVPHAAEIVTDDGRREIVAINGGFIAVNGNRVSILTEEATMAREISGDQARRELDKLQPIIDSGDATVDDTRRYHLIQSQLKALAKTEKG
ncbi:F0F1 ATP synthase subunit epsilon [Propionibacteriaceae bacterium Y1923]|uniref:F0F1 ATP synthase subunit epsilon n=1 Tax=Aestuariimicrobium sp. Y1814 TaxID=3418742 RepID=UPI003C1D2865